MSSVCLPVCFNRSLCLHDIKAESDQIHKWNYSFGQLLKHNRPTTLYVHWLLKTVSHLRGTSSWCWHCCRNLRRRNSSVVTSNIYWRLDAGSCSKHLICINSFNFHGNLISAIIIPYFIDMEPGTKRSCIIV